MRDLHLKDILLTAQRDLADAKESRKKSFSYGTSFLLPAIFAAVVAHLVVPDEITDPQLSAKTTELVAKIVDKSIKPQKDAVHQQFNASQHSSFSFSLKGEGTIDRDALHQQAQQEVRQEKDEGRTAIYALTGIFSGIGTALILSGVYSHRKVKKLETGIATLSAPVPRKNGPFDIV